jgi:hypothetical protein
MCYILYCDVYCDFHVKNNKYTDNKISLMLVQSGFIFKKNLYDKRDDFNFTIMHFPFILYCDVYCDFHVKNNIGGGCQVLFLIFLLFTYTDTKPDDVRVA